VVVLQSLPEFHDFPRKDFGINQGGIITVRCDAFLQGWGIRKSKDFLRMHLEVCHVLTQSQEIDSQKKIGNVCHDLFLSDR
jgi:hypothetical protein